MFCWEIAWINKTSYIQQLEFETRQLNAQIFISSTCDQDKKSLYKH